MHVSSSHTRSGYPFLPFLFLIVFTYPFTIFAFFRYSTIPLPFLPSSIIPLYPFCLLQRALIFAFFYSKVLSMYPFLSSSTIPFPFCLLPLSLYHFCLLPLSLFSFRLFPLSLQNFWPSSAIPLLIFAFLHYTFIKFDYFHQRSSDNEVKNKMTGNPDDQRSQMICCQLINL
jgi:hypothetical protein